MITRVWKILVGWSLVASPPIFQTQYIDTYIHTYIPTYIKHTCQFLTHIHRCSYMYVFTSVRMPCQASSPSLKIPSLVPRKISEAHHNPLSVMPFNLIYYCRPKRTPSGRAGLTPSGKIWYDMLMPKKASGRAGLTLSGKIWYDMLKPETHHVHLPFRARFEGTMLTPETHHDMLKPEAHLIWYAHARSLTRSGKIWYDMLKPVHLPFSGKIQVQSSASGAILCSNLVGCFISVLQYPWSIKTVIWYLYTYHKRHVLLYLNAVTWYLYV